MATQRVHRRIARSPEELERLKADRDRYQAERPAVEELLAASGHGGTVPLGEYLQLRGLMKGLRLERERQGLSLADLAGRTGIDPSALSRLETGAQANPTLDTLYRVAAALGKRIECVLRDA